MTTRSDTLVEIYRTALYRATPALLTRQIVERDEIQGLLGEPLSVICLGKSASGMFKGIAASMSVLEGFAAYPAGYVQDAFPPFVDVVQGSHPEMSDASFDAGDQLVRFAERCGRYQVVVLLSGGSSAAVARPLEPWFTRDDLRQINRLLVHSGLPIEKINTVRKHVSSIKGGRLAQRLPSGTVTFVLSDVSRDGWYDVGSGPTLADPTTLEDAAEILQALGDELSRRLADLLRSGEVPETPKTLDGHASFLMGDNRTLIDKAVEIASKEGFDARALDEELNDDVERTADLMSERIGAMRAGELLVAGGEPTVKVRGEGRGGRCSELAVRLGRKLRRAGIDDVTALLASSDGIDGNTDAAGFVLTPDRYGRSSLDDGAMAESLDRSDTVAIVDHFAQTIPKRPTGNNLRDIFLFARG